MRNKLKFLWTFLGGLREIVKLRWNRRYAKKHWAGIGRDVTELTEYVMEGGVALVVLCVVVVSCIPWFIWKWTIGMFWDAGRLTSEKVDKLKEFNNSKNG